MEKQFIASRYFLALKDLVRLSITGAMDDENIDFYAVLHVDPAAPLEVIRASFRTLMQRLRAHPDLGGDNDAAVRLNMAYTVLKDPVKRAEYDLTRAEAFAQVKTDNKAHSRSEWPATSSSGERPKPRQFYHDDDDSDWLGQTASWAYRGGEDAVLADPCMFCGLSFDSTLRDSSKNSVCRRCLSPLALVPTSPGTDQAQRRVYRIGKNESLEYFERWQDRTGSSAILSDLSLTGLKFKSRSPLKISALIRIDSDICAAVAQIAHCTRLENSEYWQLGARFMTIQFKQQRGSLISIPA